MKALYILFFLTAFTSAKAQQNDSLIQEMNILLANNIKATREITIHLDKCHKQHSTGVGLMIAGTLICSGAIVGLSTEEDVGQKDYVTVLAYAGAALSTVGIIISIDSHKHIGRAGRVKVY